MIHVTRLNSKAIVINADMIVFVEETPDTVITLSTRDKVLVKESADEITRRVIEYGRKVRGVIEGSPPSGGF